ncbi:leucine zipper protein [Reticulomyxa filosa]|uniref:Leucine zipper protein n=1 Tax=Reticulomyxa filosa TaxID=46433 RepID=X6N1Y4_RETFI|nr:leucine zipper protein [Reticulomyxa filosa]|eukprot:ETO19878.1 leucine zipper protein [Reticulomyxa filosa]
MYIYVYLCDEIVSVYRALIRDMTEKQRRVLAQAFDDMDRDKDGWLDVVDIEIFLMETGFNEQDSKSRAKQIIECMGDSEGKIDLNAFLRAKMTGNFNHHKTEHVRTLLQSIKRKQKKLTGHYKQQKIEVNSLTKQLQNEIEDEDVLGQVLKILSSLKKDESGCINSQDFYQALSMKESQIHNLVCIDEQKVDPPEVLSELDKLQRQVEEEEDEDVKEQVTIKDKDKDNAKRKEETNAKNDNINESKNDKLYQNTKSTSSKPGSMKELLANLPSYPSQDLSELISQTRKSASQPSKKIDPNHIDQAKSSTNNEDTNDWEVDTDEDMGDTDTMNNELLAQILHQLDDAQDKANNDAPQSQTTTHTNSEDLQITTSKNQ